MSHSKGTTNYNLPLFTKDDRPAWLTDFNSAMQEVDAVMKRTSDAARPDLLEAAQQEAADALEKATDAQTKANGALQKSGGAMNGTLDMNEHAITNVQEVELPTSGNGLYVGSVVQPSGTGGARLTGITGNGAAFVKPDTQDNYVPVRVGAPQTGDDAVNKNSLNGTLSSYMKKSGATMTGALVLSGEPTEDLQAATKKYVDDHSGKGGVTQEYVDGQVATRLPLAGGTMTGDLKVLESPPSDASAVSKSYAQSLFATAVGTANTAKQTADAASTAAGNAQTTANAALPKSGGTMTGALTLAGDPTGDLQAATKKYVDDKSSGSQDRILLATLTTSPGNTPIPLNCTTAEALKVVGIQFEYTPTGTASGLSIQDTTGESYNLMHNPPLNTPSAFRMAIVWCSSYIKEGVLLKAAKTNFIDLLDCQNLTLLPGTTKLIMYPGTLKIYGIM